MDLIYQLRQNFHLIDGDHFHLVFLHINKYLLLNIHYIWKSHLFYLSNFENQYFKNKLVYLFRLIPHRTYCPNCYNINNLFNLLGSAWLASLGILSILSIDGYIICLWSTINKKPVEAYTVSWSKILFHYGKNVVVNIITVTKYFQMVKPQT